MPRETRRPDKGAQRQPKRSNLITKARKSTPKINKQVNGHDTFQLDLQEDFTLDNDHIPGIHYPRF